MGDFGVGSTFSVDEYLQELWHVCLAIDVPYFVYWHESHEELVPYLKAYIMKRDRELVMIEQKTWLIGVYVGHAMGEGKYPEQPFEIYSTRVREEMKEINRQKEEERILEQEIAQMLALFV